MSEATETELAGRADQVNRPSESRNEPTERVELIATILMSIAIACSAFCAYEATRWSSVQSISFAEASNLRVESSKASDTAGQEMSYDASTLLNLSESYVLGEITAVSDLSDRFLRDEFRPYVEEWLALDPLNNPDAPETPFELPDFKNGNLENSKQLDEQASARFREAQDADHNGDNFVLATVFFALVLFFAGISTKLDYVVLQRLILILAGAGLAMGFFRMLTLPFH